MAQSSGSSDSGNDSLVDGTAEKEDVEEWAQNILEESFVEYVPPPPRRSQRSSSIASDDASNDSVGSPRSPRGFWHVNPGSPPDVLSDDGSVNWSPVMSSHTAIELGDEVPPLELEVAPVAGRRSVQFAEEVEHLLPDSTTLSPGGFMLPPAVIRTGSNETNKTGFNRQESNDSSGMRRCKSYSAFGRSGSMEDDQSKLHASAHPTNKAGSLEDQEHMRTYFLKFIDLVIARELRRVVTED